jgi:DNA-directed RNA polymerase specialized sigma subunit, sigma24 homolog
MSDHVPFEELLVQVAHGDEAATRQFVAQYEPFIRRAIRPRLNRTQLRAAADSADVCQSVLRSFVIRLAAGQFEIGSTADLEKLLLSMARNKFAMLARREYAQRRDRGRLCSLTSDHDQPESPAADPVTIASDRDLLEQVRCRMTEEEATLFAFRQQGKSWDDIASAVGENAVPLRKRLSRAIARVAAELGLEGVDAPPNRR